MPRFLPVTLRHSLLLSTLFAAQVCLWCAPALATAPPMTMMVDADNAAFKDGTEGPQEGPFGFTNGISRSSNMLGNMWGLRPWLGQYGITLAVQETSEVLGNVSGGFHKGFDYDGLTQVQLQMDTQRAFGWYGGTFDASALSVHGRNLSADNLGTLQTASGIEADAKTRLWELWYQQKFLEQDRLDVKIGQQSLDQEFITSQNSNYFINTMFGWPMVPSADLPGGGPAYPLSDLGIRLRAKPTNSLTFLAGVFNGSPVSSNNMDPDSQHADSNGLDFPLNGGVLAIAEVQYTYPALGSMVSADGSTHLSGTYKLGMWYDSEGFADQAYDNTGVSLATSATGIPENHRGDYSIYAVADQMLWHSQNVDDRTLNFFTRIMGTPESNRNLIDFSANVGLTLHEPFIGRDDDTVGLGLGYAHVSSRVAAYDQALTASGTYTPNQGSETFIEATYQAQITPWWQLQPDIQYVFNPGGGILNPNTGEKVGNEFVLGIRTNILF